MGLFNSVLSKIGYTKLSDGSDWYEVINGNSNFINSTDKLKIAKENPVISACVEIRAKILSNAVFYIEGKDGEKIFDDPIIKLLNKPNAHQSAQDFIKQYEWFKASYGWVYQKPYKSEGFEIPDAIYNLNPSGITFPDKELSPFVWSKKDIEEYYSQKIEYKESSYSATIELKDIIPFYDIANGLSTGSFSSVKAPSRIDSVIKQVSNIMLAANAENIMIQSNGRELFSGGNTKGSASGMSLPMDKGDKNNIESRLINKYGLGGGKRRSVVTNQDINWQSLHIKLQELGLQDSITHNANIVREAFGVPNELYKAFMKGSTFENQKEALIGFVQNVSQPDADDLANSWTNAFNYQDKPIKASFSHMPVMQYTEDIKADKMLKISTAYRNLIQAGLNAEDINTLFQSQGITVVEDEE